MVLGTVGQDVLLQWGQALGQQLQTGKGRVGFPPPPPNTNSVPLPDSLFSF